MAKKTQPGGQVYRWCDGSWLEDQDYFSLSGIFRDVYLYATPQTFVRDYSLVTDFDADFADSTFSVTLMLENRGDADGEISVSAQLYDADGQPVAWTADAAHAILSAGEAQSVILSGVVKTPRKWSAKTRISTRWCWRRRAARKRSTRAVR